MRRIVLKIIVLLATIGAFASSDAAFAQLGNDDIGRLIEAGEIEKAKNKLKKRRSVQKLYYSALLEENAESAFKSYNDVVLKYKKSKYSPLALYKIAQYYVAKKYVFAAQKRLEELMSKYPEAEIVDRARELLVLCQKQTGGRVTGIEPHDARGKKSNSSRPAAKPKVEIVQETSRRNTGAGQGEFRVQIGAYRNIENAQSQKKYYALLGYPIDIIKVGAGRTALYKVYIGKFATRKEAERFGQEFTDRFKIQYHIVEVK